jgi:hypothetical protein
MFKDKKQKEKQQSATLAQQLNRAFFFLLQVSFPDTLNQATPVCKAMEV